MFLYSAWLNLPINTRHSLAQNFGIEKKGSTEVFNNEIVKDGYAVKDIEAVLNIDAIQSFLGTGETDFQKLWEALVARIEGREPKRVEVITIVETIVETVPTPEEEPEKEIPVKPEPKKRGRPAKQTGK